MRSTYNDENKNKHLSIYIHDVIKIIHSASFSHTHT